KRLKGDHTGVLTGKGSNWGGSLIRPEATGFGGIYFVQEMLATRKETIKGKTISISGFGNVAWGAALKATELGAKVVTISGPDGYIYDPDGISGKKIDYLLELRASNQDIVKPYSYVFEGVEFHAGKRPWEVKVDIALPCATQNELNGEDARKLIDNGVLLVAEISNMGCTPEAVETLIKNRILYAPGKAVNAGGVATSGLEMTQNAMKMRWNQKEVDGRLHEIMKNIHEQCCRNGRQDDGYIDYVKGANIAGFLKVANSMLDMGVI
ncbi:MAG: NADP-specific glutamate dehydrogenase, partial [Bacteroidetes bacterium]|nr:NADP-specific glutamate dehydrogenase [Bacteroidota bacterium]